MKKLKLFIVLTIVSTTLFLGCTPPNTPNAEEVNVNIYFVLDGANVINEFAFKSEKNKSYTDLELFEKALANDATLKDYVTKNPTKENKVGTEDIKFTIELIKNITSNMKFKIEEVSIDGLEAAFKLIPSDNNQYYQVDIMSKWKFEKEFAGQKDSLYAFDVYWWKFVAENSGKDWLDVMKQFVYKGDQVFQSYETLGVKALQWNSDYIFYYYGIDYNTGKRTTDVNVHQFRTKAPTPSNNQFTVNISNVYSNGIKGTITTTNSDTYLVRCESKRYVDYYMNATEPIEDMKPVDFMIWKIVYANYEDNKAAGLFHSGNFNIERSTQKLASPNTDYYLIVVGFKDGLTTEVKLVPFKTLPKE